MTEDTLAKAKQFLNLATGPVTVQVEGSYSLRNSVALVAKVAFIELHKRERLVERGSEGKARPPEKEQEPLEAKIIWMSGAKWDDKGKMVVPPKELMVQFYRGKQIATQEVADKLGQKNWGNRGGVIRLLPNRLTEVLKTVGIKTDKPIELLRLQEPIRTMTVPAGISR